MVLEGGWGEGGRGLQEGEGSSIEKEGFFNTSCHMGYFCVHHENFV